MTTRLLLKLALRALNEIPDRRNISGLPEATGKFSGLFSSYDLAAEIDRHFKETQGFTVILRYPDDGSQTYSGYSNATTWEAAVADVAKQMRDDNSGSIGFGDEIGIVDVLEGDNPTTPGCDLGATVRFRKSGPVVLDHTAMMREEKYLRILQIAADAMSEFEGLEPTSALKQAASDNGIPEGDEMSAFVTWANEEWFGEDTNTKE